MSATPMPGMPDVLVEHNVPCVLRDGVTLVADVYRPAGADSSPTLLLRLPYDKTAAESNFDAGLAKPPDLASAVTVHAHHADSAAP